MYVCMYVCMYQMSTSDQQRLKTGTEKKCCIKFHYLAKVNFSANSESKDQKLYLAS